MATKHGTKQPGSVRKKDGRSTWEARVTLPNGQRRSHSFPTQREGWSWIAQTIADAERGMVVNESNRKTGEVLEEWLDDVASRTLRHNSLYNYRRSISYVLPWIGNIKVKDLGRPHIEKTFAGLARGDDQAEPLSSSTLGLTFRVLKMALDYCEDAGYLRRNPMTRMKAPTPPQPKTRVLSHDELMGILQATHGTRWEPAFWLHITTGMRVSEILGLEWRNVDLGTGRIRIEQQTAREYGCPGVRLMPLKTPAARREVVVPPIVRQVLRWHRDKQIMERNQAEQEGCWEDHGTVFCTPRGKLYYRSELGDVFRRITDHLGIEGATLHTFRHTFATTIQEGGEPMKTAQTILGHATERTTMHIYSHPTPAGLHRVADMMQAMFADIEQPCTDDALTVDDDRWNTERGQTRGHGAASAH